MTSRMENLSRRQLLGYAAATAVAVPTAALLRGSNPAAAAPRTRSAAAGVPAMNVIWSTDFSNGWNGWQDTPWNDQPQGAVSRPTVVTSPAKSGGYAGRFHLDGGQQRNESQPDGAQNISEGDTLIVRFTDYLESGFPVSTSDWQVVLQFKNDSTGTPPCEIKVGNGQYYLDGNGGAWHYNIGPAVTGTPIDIAVQVTFSSSVGGSSMSAWYNGSQTVNNAQPAGSGTLYSGQTSYLKTGIYRDTAISDAGTRYLDSLVIGTPA